MKINKYITIIVFLLIATSIFASSCSRRGIPRKHYSGMQPRAPRH